MSDPAEAHSAGPTAEPDGHWPAEASAYKLFAPPVYPGAIRRERILDRIFNDESLRVILLQGPAGHGKSTTLQQIKSEYQAKAWLTAWLTLDDGDNDPSRFAIHIRALIDRVCSDGALGPAAEIDQNVRGGRRADWALDRLARLGKPVALFLDEFQTIRNSVFIAFFRDLFDRVPENVRIFVGSRSLPEVGLAKLLVSNVALVIRADDLRFSPAEVDRFFSVSRDLKISSQEIGAIYRRTEGWPAALQLYRLTLDSPEVRSSLADLNTDSPRELAEYLADNVLALQTPQTQEFLLKTSLLTRLSADLCDAVTGRTDSQSVLLELERSGLFIRSLDAEGRWFKYHGLFSTIMAENLRKVSVPTVSEVHARAAQWHLSRSLFEEVVYHALGCGDYTLAADTLNVWASRLVASGQLMTVAHWFERLPLERVLERPDLAIKVAYALIFLRRERRLRPLLEFLKAQVDVGDISRTTSPRVALSMAAVLEDDIPEAVRLADSLQMHDQKAGGFAAFEIGAASNLLSYRDIAVGDFEAARKRLAAARTSNDRGGATFSGGYTVAMSGTCLIFQGQLRDAIERYRKEMSEESAHMDGSFASAALASCHIWACYEANELDNVESLYARYHDDIAGSVIPDFIAIAHISMSRVFDARGRPDKALEVLDDFERIGHDSGWTRLIGMADWERVRRALIAGDLERARSVAAHMAAAKNPFPDSWISLSEDLEGEALGRIRLAVHCLDASVAAARIARELQRHPQRVYRQIKLYIMDALLRQHEGMHNAAHRSLRKAVQLAKPGRYIRCFLDEGEGAIQLLREAYQKIFVGGPREDAVLDTHQAFLEELLAASGLDLTRDKGAASKAASQPLSDREKEMLLYLADGVSNKEMAQRLFVSENTIKFHLKNVYSKLSVANRLQAINAARQLGFIKK
ncbi:MAG: LuxR family transcriptional regulator, maltose regulon positive regulatory protein [Gammaproteobacteria bacterium]|nr:LuxR family transcriptional regulator, maltose regulon positive regulatory protein [Gammaproteobacteria bacterium]